MRIGTSKVSREIDRVCIEELKIPGIILMENAALKVIKNMDLEHLNNISVVCGKGNNGGDGFAIARHLYILGKTVNVFVIGSEVKLPKDASVNYAALINMGLKINKIENIEDLYEFRNIINESDGVVDSILGTGITRKVQGLYEQIISIINENSKYIIAVDVPSGMNSDTGEILGMCVKANKTVSFQLYKKGFLKYGSCKFTGDIIVENIGVPSRVIDEKCPEEYILDRKFINSKIKTRDKYSNKGDFGRALVVAGSVGFTGAAYITTEASVKSGAGLVTLLCPKNIQEILSSKLIEAMTINFEQEDVILEALTKAKVVAVGPGMGNNEKTLSFIKMLAENANCPFVLDADGINVLKDNEEILEKLKNRAILTPHPGEFSRITGLDVDYINENRIEVSKAFARKHKIVLVLKGYNTIITDGEFSFINSTGNSAMANGGMGDCLTGLITSFVSQGYSLLEAAYIGVFVHGYCGDVLSEDMFCVNANHVLEYLPYAIKEICE
ncbi:NAD(P)H-hydrate dehydratase [Haloimpatiens sp. FM7315]|uniref:NAD(P)H-hydrate dehydratase n=1 Tax=Haloimpatiens sp. FM7315 TaxID=3298609 RepID=UPI0035A26EB4